MASPVLADLWIEEAIRPDLLEVTTWMSLEEIRSYRRLTPDEPMLLHGGNLLGAPLSEALERNLALLAAETRTPWVSVHISLWPWRILQDAQQHGRQPSALDLGPHLEDFFARVRGIREKIGVPLLLENAPSLPGIAKDPESDPEMIAAVLEATGCPFVLDLSYAQTAASNWKLHPEDYMRRLPLRRVVEIHLSAPGRLEDGRLVDTHEALREEDYRLLAWLLQQTAPQVVTLEYWKEPRALLEQVVRLKDELAGRHA